MVMFCVLGGRLLICCFLMFSSLLVIFSRFVIMRKVVDLL